MKKQNKKEKLRGKFFPNRTAKRLNKVTRKYEWVILPVHLKDWRSYR